MLKLFKEFKPFTMMIVLIIALLFGQAMSELALPDYMSNIVDVGIQQNGIEDAVPNVIREKEMEKIKLFRLYFKYSKAIAVGSTNTINCPISGKLVSNIKKNIIVAKIPTPIIDLLFLIFSSICSSK